MVDESLLFQFTREDVLTAPRVCGLLTVPDLLRQVQRWCHEGGPGLIVDLSTVQDIEMAVFRALLWSRRHCRLRGRELYVVAPPRGVLPPKAEALVGGLMELHVDLAGAELAALERCTPVPA